MRYLVLCFLVNDDDDWNLERLFISIEKSVNHYVRQVGRSERAILGFLQHRKSKKCSVLGHQTDRQTDPPTDEPPY